MIERCPFVAPIMQRKNPSKEELEETRWRLQKNANNNKKWEKEIKRMVDLGHSESLLLSDALGNTPEHQRNRFL